MVASINLFHANLALLGD